MSRERCANSSLRLSLRQPPSHRRLRPCHSTLSCRACAHLRLCVVPYPSSFFCVLSAAANGFAASSWRRGELPRLEQLVVFGLRIVRAPLKSLSRDHSRGPLLPQRTSPDPHGHPKNTLSVRRCGRYRCQGASRLRPWRRRLSGVAPSRDNRSSTRSRRRAARWAKSSAATVPAPGAG
jgi:hypothetical protein